MGWKIYNASLGRPQDEQLYNDVCLALDEAAQQKVQREKVRLKRALEAAFSGEPLGVFGEPIKVRVYPDWDEVLEALELDDIPLEPLVLSEEQSAALGELEGEEATIRVQLFGVRFIEPGFSLEGYADDDGAVILYVPGSNEEI
jgi:hypothetical protein